MIGQRSNGAWLDHRQYMEYKTHSIQQTFCVLKSLPGNKEIILPVIQNKTLAVFKMFHNLLLKLELQT